MVSLAVLLGMVSSLPASDPPHWTGPAIAIGCDQCHATHHAQGSNLTDAAGNVNLCQTCHNPAGQAGDLPINSADSAVPGLTGTSHAFDTEAVPALNPFATQLPLDPEMAMRIIGGNVVCSTCHDQHSATSATAGRPRVSPPKRLTALASTGTLSAGGDYTGGVGFWYLVEIDSAGDEGSATFRYSKDNGTTWMQSGLGAGTEVALDQGVTVSFAIGWYAAGERWRFSTSWPFLRAELDSGDNTTGPRFCRDCHRAWVFDEAQVNVWDGSNKSHPVGVHLDNLSRGYNRSVPLDGNGAIQGSLQSDSNRANDLKLDSAGNVQCLTCHDAHYADGNTATEAPP